MYMYVYVHDYIYVIKAEFLAKKSLITHYTCT